MKKPAALLAAALALLTLSACSGDNNAAACADFNTVANDFNSLRLGGPVDTQTDTEWKGALLDQRDELEDIASTANGDVQDRMETMVDGIPTSGIEVMHESYMNTGGRSEVLENYAVNIERVSTICEDIGHDWQLSN